MNRFQRLSLVSLSLVVLPIIASAISFKDVPGDYPHKAAIEKLSDLGVIGGNPDGTFRPRDPVNRAAMLKMLYVAARINPAVATKPCFPDVPVDAWFSSYVCDAVARGHVKGYTDGKFWPARPVSRAEALKLTLLVFGKAIFPELPPGVKIYSDVSADTWYFTYALNAAGWGILPIPGQEGQELHPNWPLERGEAAAYIWNALSATVPPSTASSSAPATVNPSTSTSSARAVEPDRIFDIKVPYTDTQTFTGKKPISYRFTVQGTLQFEASVTPTVSADGGLTCRLYEIGADGFTSKYYLGLQENGSCYIRAFLSTGAYQLQLQPTMQNLTYRLDMKTGGTGDGNDGFSQAKDLQVNKPKIDFLDANDLVDFYTFRVIADAGISDTGGRNLTVTVNSSPAVSCLIFPLSDVDLYGFNGPDCNELYLFPAGTYVVAIRHPSPRASTVGYSLQVK